MARKPPEKPRDSVADEVDALLQQLPGADPSLSGDDEQHDAGSPPPTAVPVDSAGWREPTKRDKVFVWLRLALAIGIGTGITQWPYARECGLPLLGFAMAITVVPAAGAWASISAWRWRLPFAHLLGLGVVLWGTALWADVVLPRVGYANTSAGWRCIAPPPPPMIDQAGAVGQPDGTVLYTREVGQESPSIIFPSAGVLDETFRDLGEQSHVIFYDPRHLGRSRPAGERWDLQTDVADLAAVRWAFVVKDALLMDSLYLVGWSYMGAIVTQYAIENPDQVSGIVLLGSIGPTADYDVDWGRGAGQDSLGLELLRIMQARGEDRRDPTTYCKLKWGIEILHPRMSNPEVLTDANMDLCRIQTGQYMDWETNYDRSIASLGNWDFTAPAQQYRGRVLVIHGTDDPVPIEAAVSWTTAFPNARILQVENAGQLPWLEQPDIVRRALQSFFAGQWPEGAVRPPPPQP